MSILRPQSPIINWSDPLTQGLQLDFPVTGNGSPSIIDTVEKRILTTTNSDWLTVYGDQGLNFNAAGEYVEGTIPASQMLQSHNKMTVEVILTRRSGGSGSAYSVMVGEAKGNTFGDRVWHIENDNGSGGHGIVFQSWFASPGIWSIPYPSTTSIIHWFITYDGSSTTNDPIWYQNGVQIATTERNTPAGTMRTVPTIYTIGNNCGHDGTWDGVHFLSRVWSRILTPNEVRELTVNPWQIYKQPRFVPVVEAAVAAATVRHLALLGIG